MFSKEELYLALCKRHGEAKQSQLTNAKVAVLGLGGIGSNICMALARLGVGTILIADYDKVELTNVFRQHYSLSDVGAYKTERLKRQILEINPYLKIISKNVFLTEENVVELIKDYDIICEAFDNKETKASIINKILETYSEKFVISGNGMAGYKSLNEIQTKRYGNRLFVCGDQKYGIETEQTLMAPRVCACAMHEANVVLQLILNNLNEMIEL